ncbi:MAG: hypothetical protein CK535_00320 [Pelagibacteraceae bacterium]|nr:MAG: hypothetical protein CK535_00320 [Pelagibacteraceae bacterium]
MTNFFKLILAAIFCIQSASADVVKVFDFTKEEFETLKVKKIKGETLWSLGSNENGNFIRSEAEGVGSFLAKETFVDLNKTPFLNITWKVEKNLPGIVENSKKSHDYAARILVAIKTGSTALSNRAMNYVFSSNNNINDSWQSPFTKKSVDYILSTTKLNFNEWVTVKVNVKQHFKKFYNLDIDKIDAIALMTDTDNTGLKAIAYFQNIYFSKE